MLRQTCIFVFLFVLISCSSCDDNIRQNYETILTKHTWQLNSILNTSSNTVVDSDNYTYSFYSDGTFLKLSENGEFYGEWQFLENQTELMISSNIFRIKTLSNSILKLKYGELEFLYTAL